MLIPSQYIKKNSEFYRHQNFILTRFQLFSPSVFVTWKKNKRERTNLRSYLGGRAKTPINYSMWQLLKAWKCRERESITYSTSEWLRIMFSLRVAHEEAFFLCDFHVFLFVSQQCVVQYLQKTCCYSRVFSRVEKASPVFLTFDCKVISHCSFLLSKPSLLPSFT